MPLTDVQVEQFKAEGYCAVPDFFDAREVQAEDCADLLHLAGAPEFGQQQQLAPAVNVPLEGLELRFQLRFVNLRFELTDVELGVLLELNLGPNLELGCKGPFTNADCPRRSWNSGVNWCIGSGGPCIGCTEPDFPDGYCPFLTLPRGSRS